jgi:hypothetical protein
MFVQHLGPSAPGTTLIEARISWSWLEGQGNIFTSEAATLYLKVDCTLLHSARLGA